MQLVSSSAELTGALAGAAVGLLGGADGAFAGAATGVVVTKGLATIGAEFQRRLLSKREHLRVGAVTTHAIVAINKLLIDGHEPRRDDFFDSKVANRSRAEELLEGVLLKARDTYEEKKLPYLGQLYASIIFNPTLSSEYANLLISLAGVLSYEQYVALAIADANPDPSRLTNERINAGNSGQITLSKNAVALLSEIYDLGQRDLVGDGSVWLGLSYITPATFRPDGPGQMLVRLMGLNSIPEGDREIFYNTFPPVR